jgi:hypothetical protein
VRLPADRGTFVSGQSDLTGDGVPETVQMSSGRLTVEENGVVAWQSPEAWAVVDAALGDPNDDGRYEILLAFWRDDAEGVAQNQPFIIGYRQGSYRILWGGSPIAEPIRELVLADIDGDGDDDLVVIESLADGDTAVAVWRWHGWGFSRFWQSPPGAYSDLATLPFEGDAPALFLVDSAP